MVLARCLATGPEVLLLDEPTSALDAPATRRLEALARELADSGLPQIWVTHDLDQLRRLADHVIVLIDGRWAWSGDPGAHHAPAAIVRFLNGEFA
jgi:ABC-type sulfate/molybdate transport systems ATPase subunit